MECIWESIKLDIETIQKSNTILIECLGIHIESMGDSSELTWTFIFKVLAMHWDSYRMYKCPGGLHSNPYDMYI